MISRPYCTFTTHRNVLHHPTPSILNRATNNQHSDHSVHLADKLVDVLLPVAVVTTLDVVLEFALTPATSRVGELEGPKEVRGLLEIGARSRNLVHKILNAKDIVLAEGLLNDTVVRERHALLVDFAVSALVDEFAD